MWWTQRIRTYKRFQSPNKWLVSRNGLSGQHIIWSYEVDQTLNMPMQRSMSTLTTRNMVYQPKWHRSRVNGLHQDYHDTSYPSKACYSRFPWVLRLGWCDPTTQNLVMRLESSYIFLNIPFHCSQFFIIIFI